MRIVHLALDEKFIPLMQALFEAACPGSNHWVVAPRRNTPKKFVTAGPGVTIRRKRWFRSPLIAFDVARADVIVAHSMSAVFVNAIRFAPRKARVVWLGWGYDYYPLLGAQLGDPLLPTTRAMITAPDDEETTHKGSALETVASRVHTFSVLPVEVPLLRRALPRLKAIHHELPLYTVEDVFVAGVDRIAGPDLLLGNSATATNNHAEAIELLRGRAPGRVIAPLSYGDAVYGQQVIALGKRVLGETFEPLTDWMPIETYNQRIRSCGFVVMNHRRQQAVGNVAAAIYKGATVYLRAENPAYAFFRGLGAHLRSIDELTADSGPLIALTETQRAENRVCIGRYYARERVVQAIRELPALRG